LFEKIKGVGRGGGGKFIIQKDQYQNEISQTLDKFQVPLFTF